MSEFRSNNKINFKTIKSIMSYWLQLENVELKYDTQKERIRVLNHNKNEIRGLSFTSFEKKLFVNGNEPKFKHVGKEFIFWFNLNGSSYTTISSNVNDSIGEGDISVIS